MCAIMAAIRRAQPGPVREPHRHEVERLKLAIDARSIVAKPTGVGATSFYLTQAIGRRLGAGSCVAIVGPECPTQVAASLPCRLVRSSVSTQSHLKCEAWEHLWLPHLLSREGADVLLSLAWITPIAAPQKRVTVIHDVIALVMPGSFPRAYTAYLRYRVHMAARTSHAIIAVSERTKQDLLRVTGADARKVHVIPEAACLPPAEVEAARLREPGGQIGRDVGRPYVLAVGSREPRKNLRRLVEAFRLAKQTRSLPHVLLLVGPPTAWGDAAVASANPGWVEQDVYVTGYVERQSELIDLYRGASAFAFPSLYEGFGLPVLEAMLCGTPVVASGTTSIPEVAGDAAVLVDPTSVTSIARGLEQVLTDTALRERLVEAGRRRAASFSWELTATRVLELCNALLSGG